MASTQCPRPIRKHCTIHFNEDPAFYQSLSQKLESLIQQHREDWNALTRELSHLRDDVVAGRKSTAEGLTREETTFFDHLVQLTFGTTSAPEEHIEAMKKLAAEMVEILQGSIGIVDFWSNPAEQAKLRGELADALLMADIPEVTANFNRLAVEVLKLAKHRREQLVEVVQR